MFINRGPLIILVALSLLTYQRCQLAKRNPFLWIPLLWAVSLACGYIAVVTLVEILPPDAPTRRRMLGWGEAIGQIIGAAVVTFQAGKRTISPPTDDNKLLT
jgi:hypothetical protein